MITRNASPEFCHLTLAYHETRNKILWTLALLLVPPILIVVQYRLLGPRPSRQSLVQSTVFIWLLLLSYRPLLEHLKGLPLIDGIWLFLPPFSDLLRAHSLLQIGTYNTRCPHRLARALQDTDQYTKALAMISVVSAPLVVLQAIPKEVLAHTLATASPQDRRLLFQSLAALAPKVE